MYNKPMELWTTVCLCAANEPEAWYKMVANPDANDEATKH
jgi:hypothetical protein